MQKLEGTKDWSLPAEAVLQGLHSTPAGLTQEEATSRLENRVKPLFHNK